MFVSFLLNITLYLHRRRVIFFVCLVSVMPQGKGGSPYRIKRSNHLYIRFLLKRTFVSGVTHYVNQTNVRYEIIASHYVNCFAARYDRTRASELCKPYFLVYIIT